MTEPCVHCALACLQLALWDATARTVPAWHCAEKGPRTTPSPADVCAHRDARERTVVKVWMWTWVMREGWQAGHIDDDLHG